VATLETAQHAPLERERILVALNEAERRVDAGTAAMLVNVGPILIAVLAPTAIGFVAWAYALKRTTAGRMGRSRSKGR
jgi:drug/metabolite transporter (DMT)-like permease